MPQQQPSQRGYSLIEELVREVADFESTFGPEAINLEDFLAWMGQKTANKPSVEIAEVSKMDPPTMSRPSVITMLITYLFRYARHYIKKALEDTPLSKMDEFTYLAALNFQPSMKKSELIHGHIMELSSGVEVIKRMEKKGWVHSFPDPEDGRSTRVAITDMGKGAMFASMSALEQVANIVSGNLSEEELETLLPLLNKLNTFHKTIHDQDKKSDLAEIAGKYLSQ
ncbi:MarR family transcriptional regulator [Pontibacter sp. G13]|uniref:MarR family winged helix-turn-helix transcriptional regulator n=1 Tax=Pontibacter sp. G13 TaxID=3074898 RepID=UPI00288A3058|nr:MarR family transcriptional regulator [Pontibacter sp. G13]WNJ15932.1 winged helix DNA-binding protein [Pontibacter sp. G13]